MLGVSIRMDVYTSREEGGPPNLHSKEDEKVLHRRILSKEYDQVYVFEIRLWYKCGKWVGEGEGKTEAQIATEASTTTCNDNFSS